MAFPKPISAKVRMVRGLALAGLVLLGVTAPAAAQAPSVEQMLAFKPRQTGVDISTPTKEEYAKCKVDLEKGKVPGASGWVLLDAGNQPLRKYFDSNGDKKIDIWSYYKDGVEVYREIDSNYNDKPDQYRWLNSGGSKWGIDANEDGKIDSWKMISAEEAAQEAYVAVATRDYARLKLLFISEEEIRALKLSDSNAARIRDLQAKAQTKFTDLCAKATTLTAQAQFQQVEPAVPQCVPADEKVTSVDMLRFPSRMILYKIGENKNDWLHTGEIILVGQAWRLVDAPTLNDPTIVVTGPGQGGSGSGGGGPGIKDDVVQKLLEELTKLGDPPAASPVPGKYPPVVAYTVNRLKILEQIYAKASEPTEKEMWLRQILDTLCTGHQANMGDSAFLVRMNQYKAQLAQGAAGSNIAGYAHYREMWARFSFDLAGVKLPGGPNIDPGKVQKDWNDELAKFVAAYPKADDAPDALLQLAMSNEYAGKEKQEEAKKYYSLIATNFPQHPLAPKAAGAVKRLELTGKVMQLAAPTLQGSQYDLSKSAGKVVAVYYWASNSPGCVGDFAVLKSLHGAYAAKGFEIVTVNLDETQAAAMSHLSANPLPGNHLFMATEQNKGLESPLAIQYGIVGIPTIILVGKDGRVIDRSLQISELEEAIKKAL
ncbi:MAG TPA: thioredoxin-like domain-containing protein [Gemmataceae bacterium]|nr:thioredoxin-like domain-containing protein [Gemmataceae bacterium]